MSSFKEVTLGHLSDYKVKKKKKNYLNSPKEGPGKNVTHLSIPQIFLWLFIYFLQKPEVKRDKTTGKGPFSNIHE